MTWLIVSVVLSAITLISFKFFNGIRPRLAAFLATIEFLQAHGRDGSSVAFKHTKSGRRLKAELHTVSGVRLICLDVSSLELGSAELSSLLALAESKDLRVFAPQRSKKKIVLGLTPIEAFKNVMDVSEQMFGWHIGTRFVQEIDLGRFDVKQLK
jgi:hypothetical protein